MLAYILWHYPVPSLERADYEALLRSFHAALKQSPPDGFFGSAVFSCDGAPWLGAPQGYEDWYKVANFTALGILNDAAVSASRKSPHDAAARYADGGTAGVYRLICGSGEWNKGGWTTWLKKPSGLTYSAFLERMTPVADQHECSLWQRQMTLGPAPEFCLQTGQKVDVSPEFAPLAVQSGRIV